MKYKRGASFFILLAVLISLFGTVHAAGIDTEALQNDSVIQGVEKLQETVEERKWEYLSEQWKEILLKSKYISTLDSFFSKISLAFYILFGQDYSLSLHLLLVIMFWLFFLLSLERGLKTATSFGGNTAILMSLAVTLILAHLKVYAFLSTLVLKILFSREGVWPWVLFAIFFILYLVALKYVKFAVWKIGRHFKKSKEAKEKWDEKFERELFHKRVEGIEKAFTKVEDSFHE